jgi:hypothetical protein
LPSVSAKEDNTRQNPHYSMVGQVLTSTQTTVKVIKEESSHSE